MTKTKIDKSWLKQDSSLTLVISYFIPILFYFAKFKLIKAILKRVSL